ncbi:MAG: metallophosphoesterase, partial [Candidatus Marinimicrobia bacterium]|nr:metallophosphoesterase [Candidatus Neomarinimicrobiota bacterium]
MILGKHRFKNFSAFAMLSLLLSLLISGCNPEPDFIRIGIVGDQYGASDSVPPLPVMKQGVENLLNYHPDIMLHVGDMVESIHNIKTFDDYQTLFIQAAGIMESTGLPWLIALGDHDVVPPVYQPLSSDRTRENWFMSCAKNTSLPLDSLPYYSFTLKGYHFISLYSMENLHTDPRWGSIFLNNLSDAQLTWLKKDLEAHKSAKGIVILVHHPHWYVWSNWSRVHNVLKQYNVKAVIAGHYHYDQDDGEIDGIRYLVMGATGGYVKQCDAHSGGTSMVGIIDLDKKGIKNIQLFDIPGDSLLELTPRQSMDRIQA